MRDGRGRRLGGQKKENFDIRYSELEYMLLVMLCHENRFYKLISENYSPESYRDRKAGELPGSIENWRKTKAVFGRTFERHGSDSLPILCGCPKQRRDQRA